MRYRPVLPLVLLAPLLAGCNQGNRLYRDGEYRRAAEEYAGALAEGDRSPELRYNLGTALLQLEAHDSARAHLEAAASAGDSLVRGRAAYNAGNTDLAPVFAGRVPLGERRARLERAVAAYRRALLLDPEDADAKWNLELALRLLEQDEPPQPSGGGGGDEGGGDGSGEDEADPRPSPSAGGEGGSAGMTQEEAERILAGARRAERDLTQEKLRKQQPRGRWVRDW